MGKFNRFFTALVLIAGFSFLPVVFAAEANEPPSPEFGGQWVWALFSLMVVLFLAYWATRFLAGKLNVSQAKYIKVAESLTLGPNRHLYLLLVNNQVLLVGCTEHGITLLKEYNDETFYEMLNLTQGNGVMLPGEKFKSMLQNFIQPDDENATLTQDDFSDVKKKLTEGLERIRSWRKRR
ncbi:MAG TPA: flagellar biosynthetic protein FliO [Bacillota bacterium]|nr:flagellar biosynthetic protein FliO [Bacillota bacterium]